MTEDLGEENIVGLVFGFELVAADGAVGARPREIPGIAKPGRPA